jgi:hypothetical protein
MFLMVKLAVFSARASQRLALRRAFKFSFRVYRRVKTTV